MSNRALLAVVFALNLIAFSVADQCSAVTNRSDCGYLGIQPSQCLDRGCCWNPVNYEPWCFYKAPTCDPTAFRRDCGFVGVDQNQCESKGCCWIPSNNGVPWCFYSNGIVNGYGISSVTDTSSGIQGSLTLVDGGSFYGADITPLQFSINYDSADRVRIRITDPARVRYEVPGSVLPEPSLTPISPSQANLVVSYTKYPFGIAVTRKSDNVVIFNSTTDGTFNGLVFENQYLEISSQLTQQSNIYGLGEHVRNLRIDPDGSYHTMWARDTPSPVDLNEYGTHPFYLEMRNGAAHGVFLKNSNGMDVAVYENALTWRTIGGIIDLYVFAGPGPEQVIQQYHQVIGTPYMPPYWALGWHQCRYGYHDIATVEGVVAKYAANKIPLDTMWTDIDYMNQYEDWTFDPERFPVATMQQFVAQLHNNSQHYVVIVDPGIHNDPNYAPFQDGLNRNIFIKKQSGDPFIGKVWPGTTAFPDFLHPNATAYWQEWVQNFLQTVPLDGLWIDMNEISNFCDGDCNNPSSAPTVDSPFYNPGFSPNFPPYMINNCGNECPLHTKTLDVDAMHYGQLTEYDVHNLYGTTETIATRVALENVRGKRALVIARSTFSGQGHHGGHWLGDNWSTFQSMAYSIPGILSMNMFGIAMTGADICGFLGTTTEELCSRWTELGAFYTFSRNHNTIGAPSQEPYIWPSVAAIARNVLAAKYSILPYYNTLFFKASQNGGTVLRPLFFEFPMEQSTLNIDQQFMVGPALLISPVTQQGFTTVSAYIPEGAVWYDFWTKVSMPSRGQQTLPAPIDHINIHVRGGYVIPTQEPALTTSESRKNPHGLLVALDGNGNAAGSLFLDDGETLSLGQGCTRITYRVTASTLVASMLQSDFNDSSPLNTIIVMGVDAAVQSVSLNGAPVSNFSYSASTQVLTINSLGQSMMQGFTLTWQ